MSQRSNLQPGGISGGITSPDCVKESSVWSSLQGLRSDLLCVNSLLQIYEDSIVIKSVFESARQRIVTDQEQKETVSTSHRDNGGRAEDQFDARAGEI